MKTLITILMTVSVVLAVVLIDQIRETTDDKLRRIGFIKVKDNEYMVSYERVNTEYNYTHVLDIGYKESGRHIIQSYDKDLFDEKKIGNTNVGLTYYETKLIMKKMREKGWKSK